MGIGLTEELAKMLPFVLIVLRFRAFDDARDGIVYASFLALGFPAPALVIAAALIVAVWLWRLRMIAQLGDENRADSGLRIGS